jgi:hypothetical protein
MEIINFINQILDSIKNMPFSTFLIILGIGIVLIALLKD